MSVLELDPSLIDRVQIFDIVVQSWSILSGLHPWLNPGR